MLCCVYTVFFLTGCASTEDMGKMQYDLIRLKTAVKNIQARMPGQDGRSERIKDLQEQQKATSRSVSDLLIRVQTLTSELQILTGRFEEVRYFSEKSSKELSDKKDSLNTQIKELEIAVNDLKTRLARLESAKIPVQKPAETTAKKTSKDIKKQAQTAGTAIKDVYMSAYRTFKDNKFAEAIEQFEALLKNYPENEYSDNARFWIGESHYKDKQYEEAILAYQELLNKNPKSDKVPGALLKQGLAFYELNDKETGKIILEKLVEKFPDAEQSKVAKKKLSPPIPPKKKQ